MIWYGTLISLLAIALVIVGCHTYLNTRQLGLLDRKFKLLLQQHIEFMKIVYNRWSEEDTAKCQGMENVAISQPPAPSAETSLQNGTDKASITSSRSTTPAGTLNL